MKATHREYDQIVGCQLVHLIPGEFIFGLNKASDELKMSVRSIRTLIAFLKKSQNLTIKTTNKYSIISIVNWDTYQQTEIINDTQSDKPPTSNRQATDNKQEQKNKSTKEKTEGDKIFSPPALDEVAEYCRSRNNNVDPSMWIDFYTAKNWMIGKNKMSNWKAAVRTWETRHNETNKTEVWER
jgi:hypothetical protein